MRESGRERGKMHGLSRGASSARKDSDDECRGAGEAEAAVPMQGKAKGRTICGPIKDACPGVNCWRVAMPETPMNASAKRQALICWKRESRKAGR